MDVKVTAKLRQLAPDLCKQIDALRTDRRKALDRQIYLKNCGKQAEADEMLPLIAALDSKVVPLHAAAKQKLLEGLTKSLKADAKVLQNVAKDNESIGNALAKENVRHFEAVSKLVGDHHDRNSVVSAIALAMEETAGEHVDSDDELAAPVASGTGSSTDTKTVEATKDQVPSDVVKAGFKCQHPCCTKTFAGIRALQSHMRNCKVSSDKPLVDRKSVV